MNHDYEIKNGKLLREAYEKGYQDQLLNEVSPSAIAKGARTTLNWGGRLIRGAGGLIDDAADLVVKPFFRAPQIPDNPFFFSPISGDRWKPWVRWWESIRGYQLPPGLTENLFRFLGNPSAENLRLLNEFLSQFPAMSRWRISLQDGRWIATGRKIERQVDGAPGGMLFFDEVDPTQPDWLASLLRLLNAMMN